MNTKSKTNIMRRPMMITIERDTRNGVTTLLSRLVLQKTNLLCTVMSVLVTLKKVQILNVSLLTNYFQYISGNSKSIEGVSDKA